jgi:hypothetical protein
MNNPPYLVLVAAEREQLHDTSSRVVPRPAGLCHAYLHGETQTLCGQPVSDLCLSGRSFRADEYNPICFACAARWRKL